MQVRVSVGELRAGLARCLGVAGGKSSLPILSTVLLTAQQTAEGGRLHLRAYDLEVEVATEHPAEVGVVGAVAIPAKLLADVAKALPAGSVDLRLEKNNRLAIASGSSAFRLAALLPEDFPTSPAVDADLRWTPAHRETLRAGLDRVLYAMSSDETRYNLNGVLWQSTAAGLALVCTDGHRLAVAVLPGVPTYGLPAAGAIVGRTAIEQLHQLLAEEAAEPGDLAFSDSAVLYRRPGRSFAARLVDGAFPAWDQVVPSTEGRAQVSASRAALRDVLRRVLLLASDVSQGVVLSLTEGQLQVSARNAEIGEASDRLDVTYDGPAIEVAVNGRYLVDLLSAETGERVVGWLGGDTDPLVWSAGGEVRHVLMPMRR